MGDWSFSDLFSGMGDWFSGWGGGDTGGGLPLPPADPGPAPEFWSGNPAPGESYLTNDIASAAGGSSGGSSWLGDTAKFLGTTAGGNLLSAGIRGLGSIYSADANTDAANTRADAAVEAARIQAEAANNGALIQAASNQQARDEYRAAAARGIGAINAGTDQYAQTIAPLLNQNPIVLPQYRGLTNAQQIGLQDLRRGNAATLAASGLRGAGRAGVAVANDSERRFQANAVDRNDQQRLGAMQTTRSSENAARSGLAGIYANRGGAIANTEIGVGNSIGANLTQTGAVQAQAGNSAAGATAGGLTTAAGATADAGQANAGLYGDAIGALGSVLAGNAKEANRDKYDATSRSI